MNETEEKMISTRIGVFRDKRELMRALGQISTPKKAESSARNGKKGGAYPDTPESRENRRRAQRERRERERQMKEQTG